MRVKVLNVYKNSFGSQVAVDAQNCDTMEVAFVNIHKFIKEVVNNDYVCDNFVIIDNRKVKGKIGVHLSYKNMKRDNYKELNRAKLCDKSINGVVSCFRR